MDEMMFLQPFPLFIGEFTLFIVVFSPSRFSFLAVGPFTAFIAILIVPFKVIMKSAIFRLGFYLKLTSPGKVFFKCPVIYFFASLSTRKRVNVIFSLGYLIMRRGYVK